ncbi:MAG: YDG domain-containing protein, partial [Gallionella sp.]|nr:YDG domain-containing protein [Gallionella sp.]
MKRHASMNRIYRLVWSEVTHTWIAVAENAKGHGKSISGRKLIAAALALLSPIALSSLAGAAPSGGQVVLGAGSIAQSGTVTTINQTSQNLSLNWQGFNVGAQETVNFVQPSASAIAVNRIFDTNGSQILGNLNANGQVYLINPNGVLFGAGAQVNVGGLVASTLGFDDADLGSAARSFAGIGTGSVVNQGNLRGGYVALLGNSVSNTGTITANSGTAALGAGSAVTLTFAGNKLVKMQVDQSTLNNQATNGGLIRADGGTVLMSAGAKNALLASVVNNTGVIEARSVQNVNGTIVLDGGNIGEVSNSGILDASGKSAGETGGTVKVLGGQVDVLAGASVDVSGDAGGGTALFGGNYQGKGPEQNAKTANVAAGASIDADALTGGNGGKIVVWSDGHTTVDGTFSARGGAIDGDGGFVETSGKKLTIGANTRVNTLAPKGKVGDWLLDPTDFTIYSGGTGDILDTTLITNLGGGNITILSSSGGSGTNGDIILNSDVWVQWGAATTLTLSAYRHVNVNGWLDTIGAGGSGSIVLRADNTGIGTGTVNIATGISSGGTSLIATQGVGSTTIYTNAPSSTTGYKADGPADCATGSFCGTFNVYQLVRADTAGVVNNKTYDGGTTATMQTAFGLVGTPAGATLTAGTATFDTKNVGTGKTVTFSGYSAGGTVGLAGGVTATYYLSNQPGSKTANITAANLTVTGVTAGNKTYDATTAATLGGTAAVAALGGDTVTVGGTGSGTFADKNVANGKAVTVTGYTLGGADAGNYTIVQPVGVTANITAANLTVTGVTAGNKTYDGTTAATLGGVAAVSALGSDTVTVGGTGSGTFANKNVGNGKSVTVTGYTLGGADAGNYTVVQPTGVTANITQAAITVSGITVGNKTYDATTAATVNTAGAVFTGKVGGDTVTVSATGTFSDKNVANGKTVTLASSYGGADAGNYTITDQATTTANITPANLTVTGVTAGNKTYDTTTAATLGGTAAVTALGSDTVTVGGTGSGTFADKNVANGKAVTVTGYTLGGADAGNYTIVQPVGVTANITAASLSVTGIIADSKVYDGTTTATLSGTATVFALGGDTVTVGGAGSGTFANKNVGTGKTVTIAGYTLGGADAGNYTIVQPGGTANITAKALTLSGITAGNKTYDGTTTATVNAAGAVFTGLVGGDTVTVGATGTFSDKSVANGKTVTLASSYGGADAGNYAITDQASTTANITPKAMSVSGIVGNNKVYDGTTAATANTVGATLTGLVGGDTVTVSATGTFADKNVANGKTVTLASSYGGADAGNYAITDQANTTANITPKALTLGG